MSAVRIMTGTVRPPGPPFRLHTRVVALLRTDDLQRATDTPEGRGQAARGALALAREDRSHRRRRPGRDRADRAVVGEPDAGPALGDGAARARPHRDGGGPPALAARRRADVH